MKFKKYGAEFHFCVRVRGKKNHRQITTKFTLLQVIKHIEIMPRVFICSWECSIDYNVANKSLLHNLFLMPFNNLDLNSTTYW